MLVRVPGAASDFPPRVSFQCRLLVLRCPYSPRVQLHASTSACMLKIPNTGSHTIVWTQENTLILCTLIGMGSAALVAGMGVKHQFTYSCGCCALSPFLTGRMFAKHTLDTSTNYDLFLNWTSSSPNMVRTVQTLLRSQLACNEMQASARTCGRRAADSMIENVG